jgi:predicted phage tail component-like protein
MGGFVFDGVSSGSMGVQARIELVSILPSLSSQLWEVPGKPGALDFGASKGVKSIPVTCYINPPLDFAALMAALDAFNAWLNPQKGLRALSLEDLPGRHWEARLESGIEAARLSKSLNNLQFDVRFLCPDPHAYADADDVFEISEEGTQTLERLAGNAESEPVYRLQADLAGGSVSIALNGAALQINPPLSAGETLAIDSSLMTAWVEDAGGNKLRNGLPNMGLPDFPVMLPGPNEITVAADGGAAFAALRIEARSRWL